MRKATVNRKSDAFLFDETLELGDLPALAFEFDLHDRVDRHVFALEEACHRLAAGSLEDVGNLSCGSKIVMNGVYRTQPADSKSRRQDITPGVTDERLFTRAWIPTGTPAEIEDAGGGRSSGVPQYCSRFAGRTHRQPNRVAVP